MITGNHEALVSVYNPKRLIYHPSNSKFELCKNVIVLINEDHNLSITLYTCDAKFGEDQCDVMVFLPLQACQMSGKLIVGAVYRDGRVEYSNQYFLDKLPYYGM